MDIKTCDRCGREYRVLSNGAPGTAPTVTPLVPDTTNLGQEPKLPIGLKQLNEVTLPVSGKDTSGSQPKDFHTLFKSDVCAKCVLDLEPLVAKWLSEKPRAGGAVVPR